MSNHDTRDIFSWLNQVLADRELPLNAFRLAFVIAQHVNRQSGKAWPGIKTMATLTGLTDRSVSRLAGALEERGHLTIDVNRGRHHTNVYRLAVVENLTAATGIDDAIHDNSVMFISPENLTAVSAFDPASEPENLTVDDIKPDSGRQKTGQQCHPNHLRTTNEPIINREARQQSAPSGALVVLNESGPSDAGVNLPSGADPFPYFWRECPKQTGEGYARESWSRAIKRATPEIIIAGMKRYAVSRIGEEHRFTKAPAKWLDGDHWNDVLEPKGKGSGSPRTGGRGKPSYLELAIAHANRMEGETT